MYVFKTHATTFSSMGSKLKLQHLQEIIAIEIIDRTTENKHLKICNLKYLLLQCNDQVSVIFI